MFSMKYFNINIVKLSFTCINNSYKYLLSHNIVYYNINTNEAVFKINEVHENIIIKPNIILLILKVSLILIYFFFTINSFNSF